MRAHPQEEEGENAVWAITYGDLMSYLMIFFLFLYAFAVQDQKNQSQMLIEIQKEFGGKGSESPAEKAEQSSGVAQAARTLQQSPKLAAVANISMDDLFVKITLKDRILFPSGEAELLPSAYPVIDEISKALKPLDTDIVVEGHTDNVPVSSKLKYASNWELSLARANSVVRYLAEKEGIDPTRLAAVGYGQYRPIAPNDTPEHRALNRRIQITILRHPALQQAAPPASGPPPSGSD